MTLATGVGLTARTIRIGGVVQGVGFRPHVYRLAREHALGGWVLNGRDGVCIHVEGEPDAIELFVRELATNPPPAAQVACVDIQPASMTGVVGFEIRDSQSAGAPTTRISPDLPVCETCLRELRDPRDRRYRYPYINCTNCGPRFTIVRALPYDRPQTTMAPWPLCEACATEYRNPADRRFHAQPVACPHCGPHLFLRTRSGTGAAPIDADAIVEAVRLLRGGRIVAVKGIGGYHLACDADDADAVRRLRERKYRKEKAFAIMVRDVATAHRTVRLTADSVAMLTSATRPIVLAPAVAQLTGVAPDNDDLGVMLPYTPVHHLIFDLGAPDRLVMTSGNRSSEPIAYDDDDAYQRLDGLADVFLVGQRPIARRVDDSVIRAGALGPTVLRRARGLAPGAAAIFPAATPILALGADLKNAVTLVVAGQAYVSQHIGDLSDAACGEAFDATVRDLLAVYEVAAGDPIVAHDLHPEYLSTRRANLIPARRTVAVQHHRAHVASVVAERGAFDRRVLGIAFDGTGYGDDGSIWGGEFFAGSVADGFTRVAHIRPAVLAGGDAAARHPVQAAAGFLASLNQCPDMGAPPFDFPRRFADACALVRSGLRVVPTTSAGRLFDTAAALLGFTRPMTFEGQAAMWLEHIARKATVDGTEWPCGFDGGEIDWRPLLAAMIQSRARGDEPAASARAFHRSLARAIARAAVALAEAHRAETIVLAGGVMQNELLLWDIRDALAGTRLHLWTNRVVPPNDGGVSLGQAALALFA